MKKVRNKKYRPKPCVLPLGMRRADKFEIPGYEASIALGMDHLWEQHIYDLLAAADMVRRIAPDGHELLPTAQVMVEMIAEVQGRHVDTGSLSVTEDERAGLRKALAEMMAYLRTVPNVAIAKASKAALDEFERRGALVV